MHLITGHSGTAHITSANDGAVNSHVFGGGSYVFNTRNKFAASIISNNEIRIAAGEGLHNGRYFEIASQTYDTASIDNGSLDTNRIDLIVARYSKNGETNVETMTLVVIKGTPASTPVAPSYNSASVLDGATVSDFPLYKVTIEGIAVKSVTSLFTVRNDIVEDVKQDNASTLAGVQQSNASTLASIKADNATTLASIKADNATTLSGIQTSNASTLSGVQTSNAETLASVQQSNAETVATVNTKVNSVMTETELYKYTGDLSNQSNKSATISNISAYKYVEIIYATLDPLASSTKYYSSGKIPVVASGSNYTINTVLECNIFAVDTAVWHNRPVSISNTALTIGKGKRMSLYTIDEDPQQNTFDYLANSVYSCSVYKILGYK